MTDFEKYWPTACLPGEYDAMDACDQGRWRGVAQAAYQAGYENAKEDLTIAYMSGYHKGRDSMKAENHQTIYANQCLVAALDRIHDVLNGVYVDDVAGIVNRALDANTPPIQGAKT